MTDETRHSDLWREVLSPLDFRDGNVVLLDQRLLPAEAIWRSYDSAQGVAGAIREMVVRGAPAIGCAAALGLAAEGGRLPQEPAARREPFALACETLAASRPTAVNLFWAIARMRRSFEAAEHEELPLLQARLVEEAVTIWHDDIESCRAIGEAGAALLPDEVNVLTHCNAGALATGGYGTALGVIRAAVAAGKRVTVYADETRPYLQGARLTAWELMRDGIDVTLICDSMAGALLKEGRINCCVVGADRVAENGDVANKIGTYSVAVLAQHHQVPFYVAAPRSTIDRSIEDGEAIPIEERAASEVTEIAGVSIAPVGVKVRYPAFDVTPASMISALITEAGVARPPGKATISALFS